MAVLSLSACAGDGGGGTFFSLMPAQGPDRTGPANLPPVDYDKEFWIDKRGCTFIKTRTGKWVPRIDDKGQKACDRSLSYDSGIAVSNSHSTVPTPDREVVSVNPVSGVVTRILPPQPIPPSFVQVGTFRNTAKGLKVRKQFQALGFPIVGGDTTPPAGKALSVVLGPFNVKGALDDGVATAVALGFDDAYSFSN